MKNYLICETNDVTDAEKMAENFISSEDDLRQVKKSTENEAMRKGGTAS